MCSIILAKRAGEDSSVGEFKKPRVEVIKNMILVIIKFIITAYHQSKYSSGVQLNGVELEAYDCTEDNNSTRTCSNILKIKGWLN